MKTIQKTIPIIALVILAILIVGGVFFINKSKESDKASLVPSNASSVFYLKPEQVANDFYQILKRNPTYLDSVSNAQIDIKEIKKNPGRNGLNPLVDLIAYTFYDSISNSQNIAIILSVINEENFIASLTKTPETIQRNNYNNGEIIILEKEHLILIKNKKETILLQSLDKETIISELTAQQQFDSIFGKNSSPLVKTNTSFLSFIETDKHAGIWAAENNNILMKFSSLFSILDDFSDKQFNFKANEEHVDIQSIIKLKQTDFYTESSNESLVLNDKEIAKFSLTTTTPYLKDILEKLITKEQHYLFNYATGSLCSSIIGYKETPVFTTKIGQIIDPNTFETIEAVDTVEASPFLNIPEVMYVLKIGKSNDLFSALNNDSLIQNEAGYWTIPHPLFVNEFLYLTLKNDLLYLGTNKDFDAITPQFSTFGFVVDIPKAIDSYPPKNKIQEFAMLAIPSINISTINLEFEKIEGNNLFLKGSIKSLDSTKHSLLILTGEVLKFRGLLKGFI